MKDNEIFRRKFIELEELVINEKGNDEKLAKKVRTLRDKHKEPFFSNFDFIEFCRECRNRLSHKGYENDFIVYSDSMIEKLSEIIELIKHPPKVLAKASKPVETANVNDNVKKVMNEMIERNYTHIPVYDDNKFVGVFSESAMFNYLYKNEIIEVDDKTTFNDIKDFIKVGNTNEIIKIISEDSFYDDVCNEFINEYKKGGKLSCILITKHGKKDEKAKGIITTWDVIGRI